VGHDPHDELLDRFSSDLGSQVSAVGIDYCELALLSLVGCGYFATYTSDLGSLIIAAGAVDH